MKQIACFFFVFACAMSLAGCTQPPSQQLITFSGPIMGSEYRVSVVVLEGTDADALEANILQAMQEVNQSMSTYLEDSEVSEINRLPAGSKFKLSPLLNEVLLEAQRVSQLSNGAFDITLAEAINLWGFGPDGEITQKPELSVLASMKKSVGYQGLSIKDANITKLNTNTSISLSAIAKGFAVDQVAEVLLAEQIDNFLINIGGELRAAGSKPDASIWKVGIEKPHVLGGIQEIIALVDTAIATSGDYRNYHIIDGKQYSHTLDPTTLSPVYHRLALVSVKHPSAMTADALATALMAMGESNAIAFAKEHELEAYFLIRENNEGQYRIEMTESFRLNLQ